MSGRYIAFDVETPNSANSRMSAIGITVVEDGRIVEEFDTLVDPECHFDRFNVELTGITPEMAAEAPAFPELWERISPLLSGGVLAAHNAPFDLSVLSRCLRDYGIFWRESVRYLCTCQMSRRLLPGLPNHRLNTVCGYFRVPLDHHRAGSDSRACGEILCRCLEAAGSPAPFLRTYDLLRSRTVPGPDRRRR